MTMYQSARIEDAARQAVRALKEARAQNWPTVTLENDGGYANPDRVPALGELRGALVALETAFDVLDDTDAVAATTTRGEGSSLAHAVIDEIEDMHMTAEQFELADQPDAALKLPGILERARALAEELNELCNAQHLPARKDREVTHG